tara:strand:+ start:3389 stop:4444 length:1056 start_codon:yes stop_codon:yes gene_type:complete
MKILFEHQHLYYLPQFEPVIIELKDRGVKNIFFSLSLSVPKIEKEIFKKEAARLEIEIIQANFEPQRRRIIKELNFDIIFIGNKSSLTDIKGKNSFIVMLYHGIGLKNSYYTDLNQNIDLICVESQEREIALRENKYNAIFTGFPKLDFKLMNEKKKINDPFLLYAPTFFPSSLEKTIPLFNKLINYNFKIKLHHFFWTKPKYILLRDKLEKEVQSFSNISISPFTEYNIMNLFSQSMLLISDFSSTIFEYLIMDKPIIQTRYYTSRMKYKLFPSLLKKRIDEDRLNQIDFVFNCNNPRELKGVIKEAIKKPQLHHKKRMEASDKFLGKIDYCCSKRILDAISDSGIIIGA